MTCNARDHYLAAIDIRNTLINDRITGKNISKTEQLKLWVECKRECAKAEWKTHENGPKVHGAAQASFLDLVGAVRDYAEGNIMSLGGSF